MPRAHTLNLNSTTFPHGEPSIDRLNERLEGRWRISAQPTVGVDVDPLPFNEELASLGPFPDEPGRSRNGSRCRIVHTMAEPATERPDHATSA